MMKFSPRTLKINELLLDPNNYRFFDDPNFKRKLETKFHVDSVQETTLRLLERGSRYQIKALKNSILANGYVPMERIIVVPYEHSQKAKYLVIEGNRRVAALKAILRDSKEGVRSLSMEQQKTFTRIPCAVLETEDMSLEEAERVIMGIRHIAGPREWGAYQQAQLIFELVEEQGKDFTAIADHLGLSRVEVGRRYRAIKALRSMEADEEYAEEAKHEFYRLFHELVSLPKVRERFGWNHNECEFEDIDKAREFFELIAPEDPDMEPKLRTYSDIRKLKLIIGNDQAEASLLDSDQDFRDALSIVEPRDAKTTSPEFSAELLRFEQMLNDLGVDTLRSLSEQDISKLQNITELIEERIEDFKKLQA